MVQVIVKAPILGRPKHLPEAVGPEPWNPNA